MKRDYSDEHAEAGIEAPLPAIDCWPNQYQRDYEIEIGIPEFTSVCPKTGLPDTANVVVRYVPDRQCLELKSLKLYTLGYRNLGIFQENAINRMLDDIVRAAEPRSAEVVGEFAPRGGLTTVVRAAYERPAKKKKGKA